MAQSSYRINLFSTKPDANPGAALREVYGASETVRESDFRTFRLATAETSEPASPTGEELDRTLRQATGNSKLAGSWRTVRSEDRAHRAVVLGHELEGERLAEVATALNEHGLVITAMRALSESFAAVELSLIGPSADSWQLTRTLRPAAEDAGVDLAILPPLSELPGPGLLMMDMDSTLLAVECIDEIAEHAGVKDQVAAITERAMNGELDFKGSLIERVKMLEGLPERVLETVYQERIVPNPGARRLVETIRALGYKVAVVSGGFTFFTERLKKDFQLDYANANVLEAVDGHLTGRVLGEIVDGERKAATLRDLQGQLGLTRDQLMVMGDGANDLPMIAEAGLGLAYHAKPTVREQAPYNLIHSSLDGVLYLLGLTDADIAHHYRPAST